MDKNTNVKRPFGPGKVTTINDMVETDVIFLHVVNDERGSKGTRIKGAIASRPGDRIVGFERGKAMVHA